MATYSKKALLSSLCILILATGCSSMKHFFAIGTSDQDTKPIENPFGTFAGAAAKSDNITWRSKNGDRSVEVEIPNQASTDVDMPMNAKMLGNQSEDQLVDGVDYRYNARKAGMADREIASSFNKNSNPQDEMNRGEIEQSLGLRKSDELPNMDESYLAKMDVVKQLFGVGRYEAALLELDQMIKFYPTNSRLYEMRGTVLDRMGYADLAMRSWKQALEFEPNKLSLKKMINKREAQRNVASERK